MDATTSHLSRGKLAASHRNKYSVRNRTHDGGLGLIIALSRQSSMTESALAPAQPAEHSFGSVHSAGKPSSFQERLAEPHTATEHEILLKLLAQEEAKYRQLGKGE